MTVRRFNYDLELDDPLTPQPGDILVGPRVAYRIVDARPVESRVWGNRWALRVERIGPSPQGHGVDPWDEFRATHHCYPFPVAGWVHEWSYQSYAKGEKPADYFARNG